MRPVLAAFMSTLTLAIFFLPTVQAAPQSPRDKQSSQGQQFKEETLDQFANARIEINRIKQQYQKEIQRGGNAKKKRELKQQAVQEMRQAVKNQGLSLKKYKQVSKQVHQDPELRKAIQSRIQAAQGNR